MLDDIEFKMLDYFSLDKIDCGAGTYDQYIMDLQKIIKDNREKENYQVAYFYSHLMFMSYVYYCVEKAYELNPDRVKDIYYSINAYNGRNNKPDLDNYNTVYDFSKIPEKEIFKIFFAIGMDDQQIRALSTYISGRDEFAHATGKLNISIEEYDNNVTNIIGSMQNLQQLFQNDIKIQYKEFLLSNYNCAYDKLAEKFEEYLFDNLYSLVDFQYVCFLSINSMRNDDEVFRNNFRFIKKIHCAIVEFCTSIYNLLEPENLSDLQNEDYLYYKYKNDADGYLDSELGISAYTCIKEGGESPIYECLECEVEQMAHEAEKGKYHCFACDTDFMESEVEACFKCGEIFERDGERQICMGCWEDIISND